MPWAVRTVIQWWFVLYLSRNRQGNGTGSSIYSCYSWWNNVLLLLLSWTVPTVTWSGFAFMLVEIDREMRDCLIVILLLLLKKNVLFLVISWAVRSATQWWFTLYLSRKRKEWGLPHHFIPATLDEKYIASSNVSNCLDCDPVTVCPLTG